MSYVDNGQSPDKQDDSAASQHEHHGEFGNLNLYDDVYTVPNELLRVVCFRFALLLRVCSSIVELLERRSFFGTMPLLADEIERRNYITHISTLDPSRSLHGLAFLLSQTKRDHR